MTCTRAEFLRWLPGASRGATCHIDGTRINVDLAPGEIDIALDELPPRRIGALELPRLAVELTFSGIDAQGREAYLAFFDLYTRRGGG